MQRQSSSEIVPIPIDSEQIDRIIKGSLVVAHRVDRFDVVHKECLKLLLWNEIPLIQKAQE